MISPVRTSVRSAGCGDRLELAARRDELVPHGMLNAQVDGELDRLLQPVAGEPRQVQISEPAASSHFSMPAMPWLSILTWPIRCETCGPVRIDALVLAQEADARDAEPVNLLAVAWM